jgi:hypothetical protein
MAALDKLLAEFEAALPGPDEHLPLGQCFVCRCVVPVRPSGACPGCLSTDAIVPRKPTAKPRNTKPRVPRTYQDREVFSGKPCCKKGSPCCAYFTDVQVDNWRRVASSVLDNTQDYAHRVGVYREGMRLPSGCVALALPMLTPVRCMQVRSVVQPTFGGCSG